MGLNNQREQLLCGELHNLDGPKMNTKFWQPIQVGNIKLNRRLAMAPMTRGRSAAHGVATDLNAEYYVQRASMALIISEVRSRPTMDRVRLARAKRLGTTRNM